MAHSEFAADAADSSHAGAAAPASAEQMGAPDLDVTRVDDVRFPLFGAPSTTKRVAWKVVSLEYLSTDAQGFGHAFDPLTRDEFLLNDRSAGFSAEAFKPGQIFQASVTRAHFVEKVAKR